MEAGPSETGDRLDGHLLGGRVFHRQLRSGHRTGIEPVLLAAFVAARSGDLVLEAGTGSGAALLCLTARVAGVVSLGIEIDPAAAAVARENAAANGFADMTIMTLDIAALGSQASLDHAMANPPWHDETATPSPDQARDAAHRGHPGLIHAWVDAMARALRPRGTVSLVIGALRLPEALAALTAAGCGSPTILPLWPRAGREAKLVLIRGVRGARGRCRILPGLVVHEANGDFTADAQAILRDGKNLAIG